MDWFLIVVLLNPAEPLIEHHVTVHMPNERVCIVVRDWFFYGEDIDISKEPNDRTRLTITDKQCMHAASIQPTGSI